jgi:sulfur-oxidizing protein SoxY
MPSSVRLDVIDRRNFILSASSVGAVAAFLAGFGAGSAAADNKVPSFDEAMAKLLGGAKPEESKAFSLELPEIAENGNTVPFSILYDGSMADKDAVKAIHLVASGNPVPGVATFNLTPLSGRAGVSSRMRLAKTQDVLAIAEMADGRFFVAKRTVKVTIGGCGG